MPRSKSKKAELVKSSGDVFDMIEGTIDEHADWLEKWHRSIICQTSLDKKLLGDEPHLESRFGRWFRANIDKGFLDRAAFGELGKVHERMHRMARDLALQLTDGQSIKPKEYDEFIALVTSFNQTIRRVRQGLRQAAMESDPVTGLSNREAMLNELEIERLHAERTKTDVCLILVDIDKFRDLLEEHGAESGDQVLFCSGEPAADQVASIRPGVSLWWRRVSGLPSLDKGIGCDGCGGALARGVSQTAVRVGERYIDPRDIIVRGQHAGHGCSNS